MTPGGQQRGRRQERPSPATAWCRSSRGRLRFTWGDGVLSDRPLTAKVVSTVVATTWTYVGNRYWTYRHRQRTGFQREYLLFFCLSGVGMAIAVELRRRYPDDWETRNLYRLINHPPTTAAMTGASIWNSSPPALGSI